MAISGKLVADFTSFYDAVQKAEVELRSFETNAGKVGTALNRMADSFSGRKVIQEAQLMAKSVEQIGGTSKLTESELRRFSSVTGEAAEKMKLMGIGGADAMQKLAESTKPAVVQAGFLGTTLGKLAGIFTIGMVARFAGDLLESAGRLQDLSERTDISAEALQRFSLIAEQSGTNIDAVATAVFQMGKRLGGGTEGIADAIKQLGLDFETIRTSKPEVAFEMIGKALGDLEDPFKRSELGAKLFGKSVDDLIPVFKGLKNEVAPYASLTGEQVAMLDKLGDAWARTKASLVPWIVQSIDARLNISGLTDAIDTLWGALDKAPKIIGDAAVGVKAWRDAVAGGAAGPLTITEAELARIEKDLEEQRKKLAEATKKAAEAQEQFNKSLSTDVLQRWLNLTPGLSVEAETFQNRLKGLTDDGLLPVNGAISELGEEFGWFDQYLRETNVGMGELEVETISLGQSLKTSLIDNLKSIPQLLVSAFTGGGGLSGALQAIGSMFGSSTLGKVTESLATRVGGWAGSILGPLGGAVGGLLGGLAGKIGSLFSGGAGHEANTLRDQFTQLFGPNQQQVFADLEKKLGDVGQAFLVANLKAADSGEKVKAVIEQINKALGQQEDQIRATDAAMSKYGLTWEDTNETARQSAMMQMATALVSETDALVKKGIEWNTVVEHQATAFSELYQAALRTGTDLPDTMQPMLDYLLKAGLLLDEDGKKITALSVGFTTAAIGAGAIADALADIPNSIDVAVNYHGGVTGGAFGAGDVLTPHSGGLLMHGGGWITAHGGAYLGGGYFNMLARAHSGLAADEVPIIAQRGEFVVSRKGVQAAGLGTLAAINRGEGAGGAVVNVTINQQAAYFDSPGERLKLARAVNEAVADALRQRGVRLPGRVA